MRPHVAGLETVSKRFSASLVRKFAIARVWAMDFFTLLFRLEGRATRWDWWKYNILVWVVAFLVGIIGGITLVVSNPGLRPDELEAKFLPIQLVLLLALIWPTFAVWTKRFQDRDKSSVWAGVMMAPGFLLQFLVLLGKGSEMGSGRLILLFVLAILTIITALWAFIELGCLPGTPGPNRFSRTPHVYGRDDVLAYAAAQGAAPGQTQAVVAAYQRTPQVATARQPQAAPPGRPPQPTSAGPAKPQGFGRRGDGLVRPRPIR